MLEFQQFANTLGRPAAEEHPTSTYDTFHATDTFWPKVSRGSLPLSDHVTLPCVVLYVPLVVPIRGLPATFTG